MNENSQVLSFAKTSMMEEGHEPESEEGTQEPVSAPVEPHNFETTPF